MSTYLQFDYTIDNHHRTIQSVTWINLVTPLVCIDTRITNEMDRIGEQIIRTVDHVKL